jgi:hypothetical protein
MNPRDAVVEQWHAIQGCAAGLEGDLADRIWDQLECHQLMARRPCRGWCLANRSDVRPGELAADPPSLVGGQDLVVTECMNLLGTDPAGPLSSPFRPDEGQLDLSEAQKNFA